MNLREYQLEALKTVNHHTEEHMKLGILNECGELLTPLKRTLYHNKRLDIPNVIEELGDIAFYIANLANLRDSILIVNKPRTKFSNTNEESIKHIYSLMKKTLDGRTTQRIVEAWSRIVYNLNMKPEFILKKNIQKLRERHGESYNQEFYDNRKD